MATRESLLKDYPNLANPNLPFMIGCIHEHSKAEAEKGFQRVCYSKVRIVAVQPLKGNTCPSCIWRIYYELKHDNIELQSDDSRIDSGHILRVNLPTNDESLKKLFEDITVAAVQFLGMKVIGKCITQNGFTAIVEFSPQGCQCRCLDFNMATEDPRRWPKVTEVEIVLAQIKIQNMIHTEHFLNHVNISKFLYDVV